MRRRKIRCASLKETQSLYDPYRHQMAVALSLVRLCSEEEAPRPRLGSRLSAPRPVAMCRLLDRLPELRKCFERTTPHAIHDVPRVTRLTSSRNRFSFAHHALCRSTCSGRSYAQSDNGESYVIRPNADQIISGWMREKKSRGSQKRNAARWSGVHRSSGAVLSRHRLDARGEARYAT